MRVWLGGRVLGWVLGVAAAEEGEEGAFSTSIANDFELRYRVLDARLPDYPRRPVLDYVEQVNRLNLGMIAGSWRADLQLDEILLLGNRYYIGDTLYVERELIGPETAWPFRGRTGPDDKGDVYANVEKLRVGYTSSEIEVGLGDAYTAFGRGLALNMNRNVDIDLDSSIQGAKVLLRPGAWDLTLVAGQANRQQIYQDLPNISLPPDLRHAIVGVRVERFGLGPANVGAHLVGYRLAQQPSFAGGLQAVSSGPSQGVAGATLELASVLGIDWYAEADLFAYDQQIPVLLERSAGGEPGSLGYGLYVSASGYPGPFIVLVEGKRYFQAERINALLGPEQYEFAVGPTLEYERAITKDSSATVNSEDVFGTRIQVDWIAGEGVTPYLAAALHRDLDLGLLHENPVPETIVHPMTGLEWVGGEVTALLNVGYRHEDRDGDEWGADRTIHGDLAVDLPVAGPVGADIALYGQRVRWGEAEIQPIDFQEAGISAGLLYESLAAVTFFADYSDNPLTDSPGNLAEYVYGGVELQVKPTPAVTLKAFYGEYRAGIRCAGGQCRLLPGFQGGRIAFTGSF